MIKNILVHANDDPRCAVRFAVAIALAERHDARLTALFADHSPPLPGYVRAQLDDRTLSQMQDNAEARAAAVREAFETASARNGIEGEWRREDGEMSMLLALHVRYADIAVVSQPDYEAEIASEAANLPAELVLHGGRPVLIIPYAGRFETVGDTVLVAWNGSREASRALHDAIPILLAAKSVLVHVINPTDQRHLPGADIGAHLAHHGVEVEVAYSVAPDIDVSDEILNVASDSSADLVVMGAYGHSRLRETVLGGPTHDLLRHMTTPVLMSH
ncbi:MAG: universal stress protein [Alphaproteobacteria bacterium]|nr:universal stress protein [Alphaproteobacteria bacterium]